MEQLSLPFKVKKLKVGDKVEILGKSYGGSLPCYGWEVGMVAYVGEIFREYEEKENTYEYFLKEHLLYDGGRSGVFLIGDLRKV